ncbi:hypothetical protein ACFQZQ_03020 [Lysobacter koreensis]|uniref:Uncharacterized protein n=1 Tax=Lysobacter koreensis TaxID=266122 RepID=A0ABW2YN60_9GAMM
MTVMQPVGDSVDACDMLDRRVAAFIGGALDEDVAWWFGMANMVASDPIGQALYLAHVADEVSRFRQIKDWAYRVAVEFVGSKGGKQRQRSMVESYRVDWGHAAARDGAAIALFGHEGVPGIVARAEQYKCGKQAYQRVRDAVQTRTTDLIGDYRVALRWAKGEIHHGDHVDRWEQVTGRKWRDAE